MDTQARYSGLSILNHWIAAILVFIMLTLGLMADKAPTDAIESYVMDVHIALGFFVLIVVLWRVGFRILQGFPPKPEAGVLERRLGGLVHRLLLIAILVQVVSGPLYLFTEGEGMDVFGWFQFYIPLSSLSAIHEPVEEIHKITGNWILPALIGIHVVGALHHYLLRRGSATAI